jgi:ACS family glucarate transporter-like MFS transporter
MIAVTTAVAVMLYLDRVCLSIVQKQIRPDQKLTDEQWDYLLSAFFWAYALFQLPAGWLGDRFGPRAVLAAYLFLWSTCTGLMGVANGFVALFVLRLGCGLFEAGAYPLAAGIVRTWMPAAVRGFASGCVSVGGRLGGAVAPVLTVALAGAAADGWRTPFLVYGLVGVVGAGLFYLWYRNRPAGHPAVNTAEAELIAGGRSPTAAAKIGLPPVGAFVQSRALWLNSLVQFISNFAWVFVITKFPQYLQTVYGTPSDVAAWYQSLPLYAGIIGMLLGGWLSDRAMRRFGPRWGRGLPVAGSRVLVGVAFVGCLVFRDPLAVTALMCVMAFATDVGVAPVWAWSQDVGGRHVGGVLGWANMWGNFGAAVSPILLGRVVGAFGPNLTAGWDAAFALCAVAQLLAAAAALGLDARRPIQGV